MGEVLSTFIWSLFLPNFTDSFQTFLVPWALLCRVQVQQLSFSAIAAESLPAAWPSPA